MAQNRRKSAPAPDVDDLFADTPAAPVPRVARPAAPKAVLPPPQRAMPERATPGRETRARSMPPPDLPPDTGEPIADLPAAEDPFEDPPFDAEPFDASTSDEPPFDAAPPTPVPPRTGGSISQRARASSPAAPAGAASDYLTGLNPEQRLAVETMDGPVLVLAGAGTGKTRVLTTRIAHIIATKRAWPSQILAVTFTNKAAREMRHRIGALIGGDVEGMSWLGTFHSICVKILRRHTELVGLKSGFTILDTDDQIRLLKQVIDAEGLDRDRWPARQLAALIDGWKNKGLTPAQVPKGEAQAFGNGSGGKLYADYQKRLKELNACDFGDLLLETLRLFRERPDILVDYQRRFRYMLVDEYQDTNTVQYLWLRLLAQRANDEAANICCVGDDDQSIYGWRGAEVDNILRFDKDFPGAAVIRLERNYRSTGHILATAAAIIANNQDRLGKTLFTDGAAGEKVTVTGVWDDTEEARLVGERIEAARKEGHQLDEIAILVRASFQMRAFEDRFVTLGLPYRVIGGPRFYERQEIKDAIAYLEVTANPTNDLKFERIVNVPKRGLGDTTVNRLMAHGRARAIPMTEAAREIVQSEELAPKARRVLGDLLRCFDRWRQRSREVRHTELAELILDESGYTQMWQADKSPQSQSRLENLKELIRFMDQFETLDGFLEHVALVADADQGNDGDRVSLMTLHGAKGLEFETVFLPGWEEGLFPSQRSMDESGLKGLEEERRLAYVGVTRARKRAHLSFTENRRQRGLFQSATPSRFIDELPEAHVEVIEAKGPFSGGYGGAGRGFGGNPYGASRFDEAEPMPFRSSYDTPGWQRAKAQASGGQAGAGASKWGQVGGPGSGGHGSGGHGAWGGSGRGAAGGATTKWGAGGSSNAGIGRGKLKSKPPLQIEGQLVASSAARSDFACGERVFHEKFGYGLITAITGNKLTVAFEKAGEKHVVDSFVERAAKV